MINPNLKAQNVSCYGPQLCNGEKDLWDNIPIHFNKWNLDRVKEATHLPKTVIVKFTVHMHIHDVGAATRMKDTSCGSISNPCLDWIKDNPKPVITTWMSICNKLLTRMLDAGCGPDHSGGAFSSPSHWCSLLKKLKEFSTRAHSSCMIKSSVQISTNDSVNTI